MNRSEHAHGGDDFGGLILPTRRDFLGLTGAAVVGAALVGTGPAFAHPAAKRGGTLRVGLPGGPAASDNLDPHQEGVAGFAQAYRQNVYSKLTDMLPDGTFENQLAQSITPNKNATLWTITLRKGVRFHDGSELTADDVIYTFRRILDPANGLKQASGNIDMVDPAGITKTDRYQLSVRLLKPWSDFRAAVGQRYVNIVKQGAAGPWTVANANGTGPFKLAAWTPGSEYRLEAHTAYFEAGKPLLAAVRMIAIPDAVARVNALVSKQVDAISDLPVSQAPLVRSAGAKVVVNPGGSWTPLVMNTTKAPYTDPRVREAMKLLIDREKAVKVALGGFGTVGNDLFARYDELYDASIPQRTYDSVKAKQLLKAAGQIGTTFELATSEAESDFVPLALVFEEGAKKAGVKLTVRKDPADTFWDKTWGVAPFTFSSWGYRGFFTQWQQSFTAYNKEETNWTNDKANRASRLVSQAAATGDLARRKVLASQAQRLHWEDGGYIIPYFKKKLDAVLPTVKGCEPHVFPALSWYRFKNFSF
jgi:peptide/nickel transport system substrate-binding protein